jgi:hypothetical protein
MARAFAVTTMMLSIALGSTLREAERRARRVSAGMFPGSVRRRSCGPRTQNMGHLYCHTKPPSALCSHRDEYPLQSQKKPKLIAVGHCPWRIVVNFMNGYFSVMDPNDLLCMAWKWQRGDVSRHTGGDLRAALGRINAKTFVMPMSSDMFFPPSDCQAEWRLIPNAEFRPIQTIDGHLAPFRC